MMYSEADLPPLLVANIQAADGATRGGAFVRQIDLEAGAVAEAQPFYDAIALQEAVEVYAAVRDLAPTDTAEIGFCCGGSGLAILKALADNQKGMHHACDPYQTSYANGAGRRNAEAAGLAARLDFHEAFPERVVPTFPRLQFAFIDASHLFDLSVLDFVLIDKRLDVGGVVAFHDLWMASLQKLMRYILSNRGYRVYHPPGTVASKSRPHPVRQAVGALLRNLPAAERVFAQELLHPWAGFGFGNIAMLQKTSDDNRDWRHFARF